VLFRSHGAAAQALRAETARPVGIVLNIEPKAPATDDPADVAAAARAEAYMNRWFLEALTLGRYPDELRAMFAPWPAFPAADFDLIRAPLDWLGLNYYTRGVMRHDPAAPPPHAAHVRQPGSVYTELGWEVWPRALTATLLWLKERTALPLYITENGAAFPDPDVASAEPLPDPQRADYLRAHLLAAREAIRLGVDLRGYFAWSLLDNLEWAAGFAKRFGLVHVDHATQKRTLKASGAFYRDVIASGGSCLT